MFLFLLAGSAFTQNLPNKIRGYKVHQDRIIINESGGGDAVIRFGEPILIDASLTGITFELPAQIQVIGQSAKVDFMAFHAFKVNGISVEPEDYAHKFELRKGENLQLPEPARVLLPASGIVKAAWKEMQESKSEWTITGRVFVFGRFRKLGFYHKRVVPIDINVKIKNPINPTSSK